jgi:thymidylate synthase
MEQYLGIVNEIRYGGEWKDNRTGVRTLGIFGTMFKHDMGKGFPLLTSKFVSLKNVAIELEFFIKGLSDKHWLQERGCHIWDAWQNPTSNDANDLGRIYGAQWRDFRGIVASVDQLKTVIETLKKNPNDRRMVVTAWNPTELDISALPPCHLLWNVGVSNGKLSLAWYQRSIDTMLGLPYNIASYGLLLKLLALECGLKEGNLIGFLFDTHIYENHMENATEQVINRELHGLPTVEIPNFTSIFDWTYDQIELKNYVHSGKLNFDIAI